MTRRRAAVAAAGLGLLALAGCSSDESGSAAPTRAADGTVACEWIADGSGTDIGTPPERVPATGTRTLVMTAGQGDLTMTLDQEGAPCAAASMVHLAGEGYFDGSPCHRLVDSPTFGVLQCGDPTGTGRGGPGYRFAQEVTDATTYPAATVAMANTGRPESTGSQFFLCFVDTELPPDYTAVGTLDDAGLAVVQGIGAAGDDGSLDPSPGGGAPNEPVTIETARVLP
ncbi:peptidylprolyl isomerase [Blastococcus sp. SYSU D00695]